MKRNKISKRERKLPLVNRINAIAIRIFKKVSPEGETWDWSTLHFSYPPVYKALMRLKAIYRCHEDAKLVPTLGVYLSEHKARELNVA